MIRVVPAVVMTLVLSICAVAFFALPAFENNMMEAKRLTLRELVVSVSGILAHYQAQVESGSLSLDEAQARARRQIRDLRYGPQMKDYFWINDLRPHMIAHPYRPDLEGQDVSAVEDPDGKRIFMAFVATVREHGEGFVDYMWQWEDDPTRVVPKLSFVRLYEPWGWVVGTGLYTEDVAREIALLSAKIQRAFAGVVAAILVLTLLIVWQTRRIDRDRWRTQEQLLQSQASLEQAQRLARLGTWEWDRRQGTISWSDAMYAILGLDPGRFRPTPGGVRAMLGTDGWRRYRRAVVRGLASTGPSTIEGRLLCPDNRERHLTCTFQGLLDRAGRIDRIFGMVQDVTPQRQAENDRIQRLETARRHQAILLELATDPAIASGDLRAAFARITETAADTLEVERASVWLFSEDARSLNCQDLYRRATSTHDRGQSLQADQYPTYFSSLQTGRFIDAEDARIDPRTREFAGTYLEAEGVAGLLDAAVRISGRLVGVICHEHAGRPRAWRADEITLAAALADQVAQALTNAERHRISEATRATAQRLAALIEHTPLGVIEWDLDFKVVRWNGAAERIFEYPRSEVIGRHAFDLIVPEEARPHVAEIWRQLLESPGGARSTNPNHTKTGRMLDCEWYNTRLMDQEGRVVGVASLVEDVTEKVRAQKALATSEQRYRRAIAASDAVAYQRDYSTNEFVFLGKEIERLTGYRPEEITAEVWKKIVIEGVMHGELAGVPLEQAIIRARAGRIREWRADYRIRSRDGAERWLADSSIQLLDGSGRAVASLGILQDITDRRRLEEQLLQSQKMEAIGHLAGGVAHDFNNILTAIMGHVELARDEIRRTPPALDAADHDLDEVARSSERAAVLTRQLLAFSRRGVTRPQVVDLNRSILDMEGMLRRLLAENIVLETDLASELAAVVADQGQIEQVILNLAVNGRDAMPDGGSLLITTENILLDSAYTATHAEARPGPHVVLAVSDTGAGISKDVLPHIFEPFFTTKALGKGTGLGLSTVYGVIRQAGGHVTVYSEEGHGTTLKVYLPAARADRASPRVEPDDSVAIPEGAETILICEDDASVRELAVSILRDAGYTVLSAPEGRSALALMEKHEGPIDLLVTDVIMPDMNGRQLAEELTRRFPSLAVLYISGYAANVIAHHGVLHPDIRLLEKPFTGHALARRVREALDAPSGA